MLGNLSHLYLYLPYNFQLFCQCMTFYMHSKVWTEGKEALLLLSHRQCRSAKPPLNGQTREMGGVHVDSSSHWNPRK